MKKPAITILSLNKYLLNEYCLTGTVLNTNGKGNSNNKNDEKMRNLKACRKNCLKEK